MNRARVREPVQPGQTRSAGAVPRSDLGKRLAPPHDVNARAAPPNGPAHIRPAIVYVQSMDTRTAASGWRSGRFCELDTTSVHPRAERENANKWRADRGKEPMQSLLQLPFTDHLKPMVLVSLNTGMRRGERLRLVRTTFV